MIHLKDRQGARISHFSALVLYQTVVFLLLAHFCGGQSQTIDQPQPIVAMVGDDIILPCHLEHAVDAVSMTVEWARADLNPRFVHVRRDGVELLIDQNPSYIGRTSVSINKLKCGDISLKLSKVKLSDEGTYKCLIPTQGATSVVKLAVGSVSSPIIRLSKLGHGGSGVLLDYKSKGWYPKPEVVWLDGEGNVLSAGPTETVRGPDGLYTVSSRVTVEKRHSNSFTCRVQQKDISLIRQVEIQIPDDFFIVPSSAVRITINFTVCFLCVLVLVFAVWKWRHHKIKNDTVGKGEGPQKRPSFNMGTELPLLIEGERKEHMTETEKNTYLTMMVRKLKEELQKNEEEHKCVVKAITRLTEYKKVLENHGFELLELHSNWIQKQININKENLNTTKKKNKKTTYQENITDLEKKNEATKALLRGTEELRQSTEEEVTQKTERKSELEMLNEQIDKHLSEIMIQLKPPTEQSEREERK